MIKKFYTETYFFWMVSKILIVLLTLISSFSLISNGDLRASEFLYNFLIFLEGIFLGITLLDDFSFNVNVLILKKIAGSFLVLFGVFLLIFLITLSNGSKSEYFIFGFPLSIWFIMVGAFLFLNIKRNYEKK